MTTIVGLFESYEEADYVIQELQRRSIDKSQISVLARERVVQDRLFTGMTDPVAEGIGAGVTNGAVVGGLGGLLLGIGSLVIPGIGPVYAAGALLATLSAVAGGAGLGAVAGGLIGALMGWGLPQEEAYVYAEGIKQGGILVAVQVNEDAIPQVRSVMRDGGALDVNTLRERLQSTGWSEFDETTVPEENYASLKPREGKL